MIKPNQSLICYCVNETALELDSPAFQMPRSKSISLSVCCAGCACLWHLQLSALCWSILPDDDVLLGKGIVILTELVVDGDEMIKDELIWLALDLSCGCQLISDPFV